MKLKVKNETFSIVEFELSKGETVKCENGSFIYSNKKITIDGQAQGGGLKSFARTLTTGQSFFVQKIIANEDNTKAVIGGGSIGNVKNIKLDGKKGISLADSAFLACEDSIDYTVISQTGIKKGLFSSGGFFVLNLNGKGDLLIKGFGAIEEITLDGTDEYMIDNSHVLAWEDSTEYELVKSSDSWWSSIKSGENYVASFKGKGKVYIQTHNIQRQAQEFIPYLPKSGGSN